MTMTAEQLEFMRTTEGILVEAPLRLYANLARLGTDDAPPREVYNRVVRFGKSTLNAHYLYSPHDIHKRVRDYVMEDGAVVHTASIEPTKVKWTLFENAIKAEHIRPDEGLFTHLLQQFWLDCIDRLKPTTILYDHGAPEWVGAEDSFIQQWICRFFDPLLTVKDVECILFGTTFGGSLPEDGRTRWKSMDVYEFAKRNDRIARLMREPKTFKKALWLDFFTMGDEAEQFGRDCRMRTDLKQVDMFIGYPHSLFVGDVNGVKHDERHLVRFGQWLKGYSKGDN